MSLNPIRLAARVLTGSTYALLGADAVREPGGRTELAAPTLAAARKVVPLPGDDEVLVRANAAVQVIGGTLLALGRLPRLSALALVASMIPTTVAGHAFWNIEDPAARKLQRVQFHKNMAMIGGLLFVVLDNPDLREADKAHRIATID
ncbi:DoxX family protein [Nocardia sp. FBN12]|uniref:DoxX family protein n=1 Tax=Nocardia sp. FBN12 TaxID=3419766 RepID=UPI003D0493B0